ncbi:MAG: CDP-alcohol phosphatidyltransferase family protein [Bacteroidales bacterium]
MRKHIPNALTLLNLGCGTVALWLVLTGFGPMALYLLLGAAVLDFLDGFAARMLRAQSELGKQLDSLADLVSFGLLPAAFALKVLLFVFEARHPGANPWGGAGGILLAAVLLTVPLCSALRLARFNVDGAKQKHFRGLPTPANALFWAGMYGMVVSRGDLYGALPPVWIPGAFVLVMSVHLVLPLSMLSLKFTHFRLRGNILRYLLVVMAAGLLPGFGWGGFPLLILGYMILSMLALGHGHHRSETT